MFKLFPISLLLLLASMSPGAVAAELPDYSSIVKDVIPSVVTITTTGNAAQEISQTEVLTNETGEELPFLLNAGLINAGSGFVFSEDGYVLTNTHVIRNAENITVQLHDGSLFQAEIIGADELSDIALLKIEARNLNPVTLSDNIDELQVGQTVLGIGSPYSFEYSVTSGIISYLGRSLSGDETQNQNATYIQTDMLINPGNSGGPIINGQGEVIGMSSHIFSTTGASIGISFGIPANIIDHIVDRLANTDGSLGNTSGLLTTSIRPEQIREFGLQRNLGALVTSVDPGSPADKAGLKTNDVIVTIGGNIIRNNEELLFQMSLIQNESAVKITVIRGGRYFATTLRFHEIAEY